MRPALAHARGLEPASGRGNSTVRPEPSLSRTAATPLPHAEDLAVPVGRRARGHAVRESQKGCAVAHVPPGTTARFGLRLGAWLACGLALTGWELGPSLIHAQGAAAPVSLAERAARAYQEARHRHELSPTNSTFAWQFARACFDRADFATNDTERADLAQTGIKVSRALVQQQPAFAPAQYYLAMNLGQLARTKTLGALPVVSEMEELFKRVRQLDPGFDFAGPDRCLGLLYRDAPGWPLSIGSKIKARKHLQLAVELASDHPENRLNLLEAFLEWGDAAGIEREFNATATLLPKARARLAGDDWVASWADWDRRWQVILAKTGRAQATNAPPRRTR